MLSVGTYIYPKGLSESVTVRPFGSKETPTCRIFRVSNAIECLMFRPGSLNSNSTIPSGRSIDVESAKPMSFRGV